MKTISKSLTFSLLSAALFLGFASPVLAYSPALSASYQGSGSNNVQITVTNATPYASVSLNSRQSSSLWTVINNIGQTDSAGYFTQVISMPGDGSSSPLQMYATVGGQQSPTVSVYASGYLGGCTYNCGSPYNLSLSQNSLNLNSGQSSTVTVNNYQAGSFYIASNSNSSVASATINLGQITVYGQNFGTTNIVVCSNASSSACATLYVSVSGNNGSGNVWFSPSNPSLNVSQSITVSINTNANNSPYFYISSNSNSSVVSASISGSVMNLYGNQTGSANITVCQNNANYCGTLYATVSGGSANNLSLSQTSLSLSAGQSSTVTVYNYSGSVYISSNSNPNAVSANVSGSTINIYAANSGNSTIVVCGSNAGQCASIYVTVSGSVAGANNTSVSIYDNYYSPQTITIPAGSSITWKNNGSMSHTVTFDSPYSDSGTIYPGASFTQTFNTAGTYTYRCRFHSGMTGTVIVTGSNTAANLTLSQNNLNLSPGQTSAVNIYGNGGYYISGNSNPSAATASLNANTLNVQASNNGSTTITVCQNYPSACVSLYITVNAGGFYGTLSFTAATLPAMALGQYYSYQLQATGGVAPYNYALAGGNLPGGLSLSSSGLISGVPNSSTAVNFVIRVTDNYGRSGSANFTISGSGAGPGNVLGLNIYQNGTLIQENGTVYIVYKNTKTGFASASAFMGLGFKFSNVINAGDSALVNSGYAIANAAAAHPWGSWIKSGQTVYFVHELGLIPIPDWNTFLNNGGQGNLIVNSNSYDFRLPMLSAMALNDPRLR